ncbi:DNA double-strand break repair Rad50 ATPase [Crocosphaera chwakensis]|uniref:DNA double-strand break repair rad50 ATPase n=1 Tax=Crocosphaera chwakensis CCY0110 TaxID=391612 RepID=A3IMX5_9CHRO|nr:DNA double-strand break repair Rad50 ATPase [Crocosphaera chwakensis]EAZ92228.1 DNA double-strand break repair rad50 ATPase [Crocosphaera chwakensis CCY0110]
MNLNSAIEQYALSILKTIFVFEKFRANSQEAHQTEELFTEFKNELEKLDIISNNEDEAYYIRPLSYEDKINEVQEEIDNNKQDVEVVFYDNYFRLLKARDEVQKILFSQLYPIPIEIEKINKLDSYLDKLQKIITKSDQEETIINKVKKILKNIPLVIRLILILFCWLPLTLIVSIYLGFPWFIQVVSALIILLIFIFKIIPFFKNLSNSSTHKKIQEYCQSASDNISYENDWWKNLIPLHREFDLPAQIITLFCIFSIVLILLRSWSIIQLFDFGGLELLPLFLSGLVVSLISGTFLSQGKQIFIRLLGLFSRQLEKWHDEIMALVSLGLLSLVVWGFILHLPSAGEDALRNGDDALDETQYVEAEIQYKKALTYLDSPSDLDDYWFNWWFPFQRIQNYLSLSFTEQQHPLALFKLGYAYYKQLDLDKAKEYYISAIKNEDNKDGAFYMEYLTNLAKVLVLKSYGLSSRDDSLDYSGNLGDKDKNTLVEQREFINKRRMRDAKFFLEKSASIYRKNIISNFSKILNNSDSDECDGEKNYNQKYASTEILRRLMNTKNEQQCPYNNDILSGEKYPEYKDMKDIDWYKLDRKFYKRKNKNSDEKFLKKPNNKADGLFMEYLKAIRNLKFVHGMYELSSFQEVMNSVQNSENIQERNQVSYTLVNKLKEAKTHFRWASLLSGLLEPQISRELEDMEVDGKLKLKIQSEDDKPFILANEETLFSSKVKIIDEVKTNDNKNEIIVKDISFKNFKEQNPEAEILKPLCYYRLAQFLSIGTIKLLDDKNHSLEKFYENREKVLQSEFPTEKNSKYTNKFNQELNGYIEKLQTTQKFEELIKEHRKELKKDPSIKRENIPKEEETINLKKYPENIREDLDKNLYKLEIKENASTETMSQEKYLNQQMVKDYCDIQTKVPIEILDLYERKMLYDLRRIPGLPDNPA